MRVVITGAGGFTARHLAPLLSAEYGPEVTLIGLGRNPAPGDFPIEYHQCDLTDAPRLRGLLRKINPHRIYHLAGTFTNDFETDYQANVFASFNVLESASALKNPKLRVLVVGSAAEYGEVVGEDVSVDESQPLKPVSAYGLTKVYQTELVEMFVRRDSLNVVIARPFNLIGKGMSERLFVGRLTDQIHDLLASRIDSIQLGSINGLRDFVDVSDATRGFYCALENGHPGDVFNIGSGRLTRVSDLLDLVLGAYGLSRDCCSFDCQQPNELDRFSYCASTRRLEATGWRATVRLSESVNRVCDRADTDGHPV